MVPTTSGKEGTAADGIGGRFGRVLRHLRRPGSLPGLFWKNLRHPFPRHPLTDARCALAAVIWAAGDAGRAWAFSPVSFGPSHYDVNESGGWRLIHRRSYRSPEVLRLKMLSARQVFADSFAVRTARNVRIPHRPTEGLVANLLHVIEILHRVRTDARVSVDWVLTGAERGFRYGKIGDDVWAGLFEPVGPGLSATPHRASASLEPAFWGTGKDRLSGRSLQRHRRSYHSTVTKWLRVSNEELRERVRRMHAAFPVEALAIGVHRRVANVRVEELQHDGKVPSLDDFIGAVHQVVAAKGQPDHIVFLATDDAAAIALFKNAFGSRLRLQEQVQRTTADLAEVHFRDWGQVSIGDAVDVMADALLLAQCDVLIHASSSISTFASIANPEQMLVRVAPASPSQRR